MTSMFLPPVAAQNNLYRHKYSRSCCGSSSCHGGYSDDNHQSSFGTDLMKYQGGYDYCPNSSNIDYNIHQVANYYSVASDHRQDLVVGDHLIMAEDEEDESRTHTQSTNTSSSHVNEEVAAGPSSSKEINITSDMQEQDDQHHDDDSNKDITEEGGVGEGWLQLRIGSHMEATQHQHPHQDYYKLHDDQNDQTLEQTRIIRGVGHGNQLIELDLLPPVDAGIPSSSLSHSQQPILRSTLSLAPPAVFHGPADHHYFPPPTGPIPTPPNLFLQHYYHQGSTSTSTGWAFRSSNIPSSSSSSLLMPPMASYFARPVHVQGARRGGPNLDFRVVDPPRRPHSGIWFLLQASQLQANEPFLPQIPKSYLRVKDGRMTVGLIIKYLVKKLRLDSESEIEIRCRGQQLLPLLTLQHVRDSLWRSREDEETIPPPPPATTLATVSPSPSDHLMVLHYGRRSSTA